MSKHASDQVTVSPYLVWFLIHGVQTGIALLSFQSSIIKGAEQDAWLSLLGVGICMHGIVWMIYYVLKHSSGGDLISLNRQLFGRWLGGAFTLGFYGYTLLYICTEIRSYVEVIHIWVFPDVHTWELSLVVLIPAVYIVTGGFRVVTGICLICVIIPSALLLSHYFPLKYAHWMNFLPMFNHSLYDYAVSAHHSVPLFLGAEFLLLYYPYVKNKEKSRKWAHIAILHSNLIYMFVCCVTLAYFNQRELQHVIWPTLVLSKIIRFPFLERFDYIYIFNWFLIILPSCCIALWAGARIVKNMTALKARTALWITAAIVFVMTTWLQGPLTIERLDSLRSWSGHVVLFGYLPILVIGVGIANLIRRRRPASGGEAPI